MKTLTLTILTLAFSFAAKAQPNNEIIKMFDQVEYYSDLKIRTVYNTSHGEKHGYSIEFDQRGFPLAIGKFKHGQPVGTWRHSNRTVIVYKKKQTLHYDPPFCYTASQPIERKFDRLYKRLTR